MNEKNKARIIEACLADYQAGRQTREACYRRYPWIKDELKTAFELVDAAKKTGFTEAEKSSLKLAKARLMNRLPDREQVVTKTDLPRYHVQTTERRFAMTWVIIVSTILSLLAGTGAVYASNDAIPGDALYPIKLFTEDFQLMLSPDAGDAQLYLKFSEYRLQEMQELIARNRLNNLDEVAVGYQNQTRSMETLMARIEAKDLEEAQQIRTEMQDQLQEQAQTMQKLMARDSLADQEAIQDRLQTMLQTNTRTQLRIHTTDEELPEETVTVEPSEAAPDISAEETTEPSSGNGEQIRNNAFVNATGDGQNATFTFRIANAAQSGVYAEVNGHRYACTTEGDVVTCSIPQADASGVLNLYSNTNDKLLYSYSYDYDWLGTKEPQSQGGSQTQSGSGSGSGSESGQDGQGGKGGGKGNK